MKHQGEISDLKSEIVGIRSDHQEAIARLNARLANEADKLSKASSDLAALSETLANSQDRVAALRTRAHATTLKSKFLDHHLRYVVAKRDHPGDYSTSQNLFTDFVRAMWKTQERLAVEFAFDQRSEPPPVGVGPQVYKYPDTEAPRGTAPEIVLKTATFGDGSSYDIPNEIARAVHSR